MLEVHRAPDQVRAEAATGDDAVVKGLERPRVRTHVLWARYAAVAERTVAAAVADDPDLGFPGETRAPPRCDSRIGC
jgi:hypothetical protein